MAEVHHHCHEELGVGANAAAINAAAPVYSGFESNAAIQGSHVASTTYVEVERSGDDQNKQVAPPPIMTEETQTEGDFQMVGVDFSQHDPNVESDNNNAMEATAWRDSLLSTALLEDATENSNKLNMSLDELIAHQNSQTQQERDVVKLNVNGTSDDSCYPHHAYYHHRYKGRRGLSTLNNRAVQNISLNQYGRYSNSFPRNTPFAYSQRCSQQQHFVPPPPPYASSHGTHPLPPQLHNPPNSFAMAPPLRQISSNALNVAYGPQFDVRSADFSRRQPQQPVLRRTRLFRAEPYDAVGPLNGSLTQLSTRDQLVAELLVQQQRTRKALLLAGVHPDTAEWLPSTALKRGLPTRPSQKRCVVNSIALAEQSALNESELVYPVFVEDESGSRIESPDDALIIKFKGTDVLKVRKSRGDLILNSGGWRTLSTRLVLNKALKPLGIWIEEVPSEQGSNYQPIHPDSIPPNPHPSLPSNEWRVVDGKASYLAKFTDGMVIGGIGVSARAQLMARASVIAQNWKQVKNSLNVGTWCA